jgi:hypothetical protein
MDKEIPQASSKTNEAAVPDDRANLSEEKRAQYEAWDAEVNAWFEMVWEKRGRQGPHPATTCCISPTTQKLQQDH